MLCIVDRLSDPDDGWQKDSLRLRILKQFIKYLHCCVYYMPDGKKKSVYVWHTVIMDYTKTQAEKKGCRQAENPPGCGRLYGRGHF